MRNLLAIFIYVAASVTALAQGAPPPWSDEQLQGLRRWTQSAPLDALPTLDLGPLDSAIASGDVQSIGSSARALALRLARLHLHGSAAASDRAGWRIGDDRDDAGLDEALDRTIAAGTSLDAFFAGLNPPGADYQALRAAYADERDAGRRLALARNMERWRWMPHDLGRSYLLVNTASFEVQLWRNGIRTGTWPVVVGKVASPTPVFSARVTGVTLNPWWDIPTAIVAEMHGKMPASKGYVFDNGRWRQRPGNANSLGRMKLAMQNPWNVYLHDTPSKTLFARPVRAFSHGCVRVGDAIGFAETLLAGVRTKEAIDRILASGLTTTVDLDQPMPVYIAYFTAGVASDGKLAYYPDIYGRDSRIAPVPQPNDACGV